MGPLTREAWNKPLSPRDGFEPSVSLVGRKTCSRWFESGFRANCRKSPGALWAHRRTQVLARTPGSSSPGVSGADGGENGSQNFTELPLFIKGLDLLCTPGPS